MRTIKIEKNLIWAPIAFSIFMLMSCAQHEPYSIELPKPTDSVLSITSAPTSSTTGIVVVTTKNIPDVIHRVGSSYPVAIVNNNDASYPVNSTIKCYPLASSGKCYISGEFCPSISHNHSGIDVHGNAIICKNNNGWRWE